MIRTGLSISNSQNHALAVRDLINQFATEKNTNYCCRVTANDGELGETYLRQFQNNELQIPTILTTSEKLSTGVDTPELRNIVLLRPIHQVIEFKQIIGRGTRLFDGKDYFTIYDYYGSDRYFNEEWDGGPVIVPPKTGSKGRDRDKRDDGIEREKAERKQMIIVKLSDGKARKLDLNIETSFWDPTGKPLSAEDFLKRLFGDLPTFFSDENELRKIWSDPTTRKELLAQLGPLGYTSECWEHLAQLIHAEESDIFDVSSYVAYDKPIVSRKTRAEFAKEKLHLYTERQQEFLRFVLDQYISEGVAELDTKKLPDLLTLKYLDVNDAINVLGNPKTIREIFAEFQTHLSSHA